jgi:polysaccharide biosynthesis/export protein
LKERFIFVFLMLIKTQTMRLFLLFAGLIFFASCVSNKQVMLLQKGDVNRKDLPKDSVLRQYTVGSYDYKIQANDILSVRFESLTPEKYDFLSRSASLPQNINLASGGALIIGEMVNEHGEIPFPVLGKVKVSGLSIFEIREKLQDVANQYLESPVVKVTLINFRITLLGEVNTEGTILLTNNRVTVLEAIGLAGGLGEFADRSNIKLIRQRNGQTEVQYIDLLSEDFIKSSLLYVHQNDVLIVPPLKQRPFRKYFGQNLSLIVSTLSLLVLTINLTR